MTRAKRTRIPGALAAALVVLPAMACAQVVTDGTVGPAGAVRGPAYLIPETLGLHRGTTLLHSFSAFNLQRLETATFTTALGGIERVIARVTGGRASEINGLVRVTIAGASFYLVNPSGIVFGESASMDVPGAFYASTAHYLRLADGTRVAMTASPEVTLTAAPPAAFGFDGPGGEVLLRGAQLRVRDGQNLGIVAGDLRLAAGAGARASTLTALSGGISLVATGSAGEARLDGAAIRPEGFGAMGALSLRDNALVSVNEVAARPGAGTVFVRGGNVEIDHSTVRANTRLGNAAGIDIGATETLAVRAANVTTVTTGAGNAGSLTLSARDMRISDESLVDTSCDPGCTTGLGGRMTLAATGTLRIEGTHPVNPTYVVSNSFGGGRTGEIEVSAGRLEIDGNAYLQGIATANSDSSTIRVRAGDIVLTRGGQIDGGVQGTGQGGLVDVAATGAITIDGVRQNLNPNPVPDEPGFFPSGIFSNTLRNGNAGNIVVSTRTLDISGGGEVSSSAGRLGVTATGVGGSVTVNASERVTVRGYGTSPAIDASAIVANTFGAGEGGSIAIASPLVQVLEEGRIQTQSEGGGDSGAIRITGGDLTVASRGQVASSGFRAGDGGSIAIDLQGELAVAGAGSGLFASASGEGDGGNIDIAAARVVVRDSGAISTQTRSTSPVAGHGGTVRIRARDSLAMAAGGLVTAGSFSTGDGGDVDVRSDGRIDLTAGARITTTTEQSGDAGTVRVEAREAITLADGAELSSESRASGHAGEVDVRSGGVLALSGGARISTATSGSGDGGIVRAEALGDLSMADGASISSESLSRGLAGRLDVRAGGTLTMTNGARITTQALSSDGGDIALSASAALLDASRITTEVGTGQGGGGNMEIRVDTLVMRNALITANAFGGPGGNIHIVTTTFIPSADSQVTASSQLGVDGTITIESPAIDPTGELLVPPAAFFDAGSVLAGRCGPRLAGRASSLVVEPRRLADVAPDALRSMLDLLEPRKEAACCPALVAGF